MSDPYLTTDDPHSSCNERLPATQRPAGVTDHLFIYPGKLFTFILSCLIAYNNCPHVVPGLCAHRVYLNNVCILCSQCVVAYLPCFALHLLFC